MGTHVRRRIEEAAKEAQDADTSEGIQLNGKHFILFHPSTFKTHNNIDMENTMEIVN